MFSNVVVKSVSNCGVYCVACGIQYTPQSETLPDDGPGGPKYVGAIMR